MSSDAPDSHHAPRIAFRYPDFRYFILSRLLATFGNQMQSLAIGWQVYDITHNKMYLGYIGLVLFIPNAAFSLLTGHVADRFDRRRVVQICQVLLAAGSLALALLTLHGIEHHIGWIFALLFLIGTAQAFLSPASQSLPSLIVPPEHLSNAITWSSTCWHLATIVGPALGGFLYWRGGPATVYFSAGALMFCSMISVGMMRIRPGRMEQREASVQTLLAGVHYVWSQKVILGCISLDLFAVLLGGATALLPVYAKDILHVDTRALGLLRGAPALGALLMALAVTHLPPMRRAGAAMLWSVAGFGLFTIIFGISTNYYLSLACLALLGAFDMISVIVRHTLVQLLTPKAMLGRVSAVNMVFIGASNELGEFESGVTAAWFGAVKAVVLGGVGTVVVVALWAWLFPAMRRIKRLDQSQATPEPAQEADSVAP